MRADQEQGPQKIRPTVQSKHDHNPEILCKLKAFGIYQCWTTCYIMYIEIDSASLLSHFTDWLRIWWQWTSLQASSPAIMPIADAPGMFNDRKLNDLNIKKCNMHATWAEVQPELKRLKPRFEMFILIWDFSLWLAIFDSAWTYQNTNGTYHTNEQSNMTE